MTRAPIRIQRSRAKGFRLPPGAIVVTRPTLYGNPWIPGKPGRMVVGDKHFGIYMEAPVSLDLTAEACVDLYTRMLDGGHIPSLALPVVFNDRGRALAREWLFYLSCTVRNLLPKLRGKDLACYCKLDCACHADTLLHIANEATW